MTNSDKTQRKAMCNNNNSTNMIDHCLKHRGDYWENIGAKGMLYLSCVKCESGYVPVY